MSTDTADNGDTDRSFKLVWTALMKSEVTTCSYTLKHVEAVVPPSAVILDVGLHTVPKFVYSTECPG